MFLQAFRATVAGLMAGSLILVATPIGNLGDLSERAIEVLSDVEHIYCEDTRRTRALLSAKSIPGKGRLVSLHEHNEEARVSQVLTALEAGESVAVVSDAGTPGISDPGQVLVANAVAHGFDVTTVPGPSSVIAALVVSGLPTERFIVEGFLPRRGKERAERIAEFKLETRTIVILESPRRVAGTLGELALSLEGERKIVIARELTKLHEEIWRGTLEEAESAFAERELKGEVVLVLGGGTPRTKKAVSDTEIRSFVETAMADGLSRRDAAHDAAELFGISRRRAYEVATSHLTPKGLT